jgi:hypothetical protein
MKIILARLLIVTCAISNAADPTVVITLGQPKLNKTVDGVLDYPAKITNNGKKSVWVYSVGGDSTWLYYGASTRSKPTAKWESLPYGMCGVGATAIELGPGASFSFKTIAPVDDAGLEYRVELDVMTSLRAESKSIEVVSPAVVIPKVEQAGAGQPATRPESKSEGGDKPQPEAEGRSR